jgi:hypothetical protein
MCTKEAIAAITSLIVPEVKLTKSIFLIQFGFKGVLIPKIVLYNVFA